MKQAVMDKPGEIRFRDVPVPVVEKGQLLLKILRIGICGSDIHVWHGKHPFTPYPVVQGHEVSGRVVEIGEGASGFSKGDIVTFLPQLTCGECLPCRTGNYHICENLKVMGFQTTGAASEFFAIDAGKCLKLPEGVSPDQGAMIEPLAVAAHALGRIGSVKSRKVMVYGAGPIGNLVAQAARGLGASSVMVSETSQYRLALAERCGIPHRVNPLERNLEQAIIDAFGPDKADVTLDCVVVQSTVDASVANARKGSEIVIVGVAAEKPKVDLGLVQDRELKMIGTLMYRREDFETALGLIEAGLVLLEPLMSRHFPFDAYREAYEFIEAESDRSMKVFIDLD